MRKRIEQALAAWRDADRRLQNAVDGESGALEAEVERHRNEFQQLSAEHMIDRIDALREAESRRSEATPSTPPFHVAAREEKAIAAEIWNSARQSDEDTPQTVANQAHATPREMGRLD